MRKRIVAGNWKMNKDLQEGIQLCRDILSKLPELASHQSVILCPPFIHLSEMAQLLKGSPVHLGAQNCHFEPKGAFTGEVSAGMLLSTGTKYVILGHSERRHIFGETNDLIGKKVSAALEAGLNVMCCCGEPELERNLNRHELYVSKQLQGIFGLPPEKFANVILAYEPVWAIGTGKTAAPEQAQEMHRFIRHRVEDRYGKEIAQSTTILYGGSCNAKNAKELFSQPDVDGGLIGGAALTAEDFIQIIQSL